MTKTQRGFEIFQECSSLTLWITMCEANAECQTKIQKLQK